MPAKMRADEEFTIDELAARADMTVRNVRAYASRGLLEPPRLEGRTGYYSVEHLQRLQLVRELVDRGYTLAAVEKAITASPRSAPGHTLDLLQLLEAPEQDVEPEIMSRRALAAIAGVTHDNALIDAMSEFGLVEWIDDDTVKLMNPQIVRSGAAAVALGLDAGTVIGLFPLIRSHLRAVSDEFVTRVVADVVDPFVEAGLPDEGWEPMLGVIEALLPVASQVVLGIFRQQLSERIDAELAVQFGDILSRFMPQESTTPDEIA